MQSTRKGERNKRSRAAEAAFRDYVSSRGAELLDDWLGAIAWHRVRCAAGHECRIKPNKMHRNRLCQTCEPVKRKSDSVRAEADFRKRLELAGVELLEPWLGTKFPHRARCQEGHDCLPHPNEVLRGGGACVACSGRDTQVAAEAFRRKLEELGCTLLDTRWRGTAHRYLIRCAQGHEGRKRPSLVTSGGRPCSVCSGRDSATAEAAFRSTVRELGGEVLEAVWLGVNRPHRVRCVRGHFSTPLPGNVHRGQGLCQKCRGLEWTAFYVVTGARGVKLGVTSRDGSQRLNAHKRDGYHQVVRLILDLPDGEALTVERVCLNAMADAGIAPIRGREYFPPEALPVAIDIVDGWFPEISKGRPDTGRKSFGLSGIAA